MRTPKYLLMLVLSLLIATPALALELLSPGDNDIVSKATRLVIKGGDKPAIDAITIAINGEKSDLIDISSAAYRQSFRDFVFLEAEFDAGVNQIEVDGYAAGKKVQSVKAKVFLPVGTAEPPAPFAEKVFHTAANEALCAGCHHNLDPSAKDLASPVPGQNPCSTCHAAILDGKMVHGPAGVYDCGVCHDPKSTPAKYAVPDPDGRFCLECHDDFIAGVKKNRFVHGPVAAELCLTCHDPHASDAPGLVRGASVNASCSGCHEQVTKTIHAVRTVAGGSHILEGARDPLRPGKPFNCASCHDPHGGAIGTLLRDQAPSAFALCQKCHKK